MALIAISGKIGRGKDTVGKIIQMLTQGIYSNMQIKEYINGVNITGFDWQIKKFADKLKDIVCLLIRCTRKQLEDQDFKNKELGEEWSQFQIYNYGKPISYLCSTKEIAEKYCIENSNSQHSYTYKEIKLTPRNLLQLLGTDCGRDIIHPNIWVNSLFADYKDTPYQKGTTPENLEWVYDENYPNWIITDLRFPNELKAVKDRSGINIRVERHPSLLYPLAWEKLMSHEVELTSYVFEQKLKNYDINLYQKLTHESETALDNATFDYVIDNDGSIEELVVKVKEILIKEKII